MIFVFGSNTGGIHGAGAARDAYKNHGARWHQGYGHHGNSFAIPTKSHVLMADGHSTKMAVGNPLSIADIQRFVFGFLAYAKHHPDLTFKVTRIGCGLAGFFDHQIAPMFLDAPSNCYFDSDWHPWLGDQRNYWGHVE